ncbi:curli assembly protein CsgF [Salegentibacter salinarum]|uniref:Curli production assembly/transport component CsgF n=1 Tax=Salegentibacter salinarum TaxID=447422 RepID=A0A2N0TXZ9_9FLAO|nr:curli production assembly/transport component CsgF [Salegentibacter salinarum]PKD19614.1 curli assembly protein CsgF [Salegentibacter salinarum]SKB42332.1 curli production assembly/transport component CsgF [Salegentibacter salinarum]
MKLTFTLLCIFGCFYASSAQDLVYQPTNPAFGGNPYNYQWLLSSAEAQNSFEDPDASLGRQQESELERFTSSLNSQLLGQVTRRLFTDQFGQGALEEGTYSFGSLAVDIYPSNEGLVINILDTETGEQTQVVIPN